MAGHYYYGSSEPGTSYQGVSRGSSAYGSYGAEQTVATPDDIGCFIREERMRTEMEQFNHGIHQDRLSMFRQNVEESPKIPYQISVPTNRSELLHESPDVLSRLDDIYEKASRDPSLTSPKRIDFLVRGVKLELAPLGMRPDEMRGHLVTQIERLIREKKWSLTYSEALEEGTLADEQTTQVKSNAPFYCNFCDLKYLPDGVKCKMCHADFLLRIDLEAHVFVDHNIPIDDDFNCPYCPESFRGDAKSFRDHIYLRHFCADDHLECPYGCKMLVLKSIPSDKHYKMYHFCKICGDKIGSNMEYHMERFHAEAREPMRKSKPAVTQEELIMRAKQVLEDAQLGVGVSINTPASIGTELMESRSPARDSRYRESYLNVAELDGQPMEEDTESSDCPKFSEPMMSSAELVWKKCNECGLRSPLGGFKCQLCNDSGFKYKAELIDHISSVHGYPTPEFELVCEICLAPFLTARELFRHIFSVAHPCKSEHLPCPHDPRCVALIDSKAEMVAHVKQYHISKHDELRKPMRDPEFCFELAPRVFDPKKQSVLNISKVRNKHLKFPLDFTPDAALRPMLTPKHRADLIDAGFMHCSKCYLIYHPSLSKCGRCDLKFIFPEAIMEHMVNAHDVPEIYSEKRCPFCREMSRSYTEFLNHLVTHFCREHSECEFGCSKLVIGGPKEVVKHALDFHASESSKHNQNPTKELYGATKNATPEKRKPALVAEDPAMTAKAVAMCLDCKYEPGLNEKPCNCDRCPAGSASLFSFASRSDYLIHLDVAHLIKNSEKVLCACCSASDKKKGSNRKFGGDGLNQHRQSVHGICAREHLRCKQCQVIVPFAKQQDHLAVKHGIGKPVPLPPVFSEKTHEENYTVDEDTKGSANPNKRLEPTKRDWKHCKFCPYSVCYSIIYACNVCEVSFFAEVDLDFHLFNVHRDDSISDFKCGCGYSTRNVSCWIDHRKEEHNVCAEHIACSRNKSCVWLFPNKKDLLHHYQMNACKSNALNINSVKVSAQQCATCKNVVSNESFSTCLLCTPLQKNFPTLVDYASHLNLNHRRFLVGCFKCSSCTLTTEDVTALKKHMISEHGFCSSGHALCTKRIDCSILIPDSPVNVVTHKCNPLNVAVYTSKIAEFLKVKGAYRCQHCKLGFDEIVVQECPDCPLTFLSREELAGHLKIDHQKTFSSAFPCGLCNSSFPGHPEKLLMHRLQIHLLCPFHKYEFGRVSRLCGNVESQALAEGLKKADVKSFVCTTCNRDVRSFDKLEPPKQCPICPFNPGFYAESEFIVHMQDMHRMQVAYAAPFIKCYQGSCSFVAASPLAFVEHRVRTHSMCYTHLVCPMFYCREIFNSVKSFLSHVSSCAGTKPKVILDGISMLGSLEGTFQMVVRPFYHYKCDKCPFNIATSLFYKCNLCKVGQDNQSSMYYFMGQMFVMHLIQKHSFAEPKEHFTCQFCTFSTFSSTLQALRDHMRTEHEMCARHYICSGSCFTIYPRMRKFNDAHNQTKSNCCKLPLEIFQFNQFSYDLVSNSDELSEIVFKTSRRSIKFANFSGLPSLTDAQGNTTLKSIFTAAAGMLPSELLEETKQKLQKELTRHKKKLEKRSQILAKKERSKTPSRKKNSRSASRSPSYSRRANRPIRRSRSRTVSRPRRVSRSRSISRRRRSRTRSRPQNRSRSRSVSRRRRRLPSRSRSISRKRDDISPTPRRRRRLASRSRSISRKRSNCSSRSRSTSRRKVTRNVLGNVDKESSRSKHKWGKDADSKTPDVVIASAGDGVQSKSLSMLMNEYSEPHSLTTLAEQYSKDLSPERPNGANDIEESNVAEPEPESSSQWEDVMSSMLNYTDELMVKSEVEESVGADSAIQQNEGGIDNPNGASVNVEASSDVDGHGSDAAEKVICTGKYDPEEAVLADENADELLINDDHLDEEL